MHLIELGQAVWLHATHATDVLAVATWKLAPPTPGSNSPTINTDQDSRRLQ